MLPEVSVDVAAFVEAVEKRLAADEDAQMCCVCYEPFANARLKCVHRLCPECFDKLDTCPMCRTVYKERPPPDDTFHWCNFYASIRNIPNHSGSYFVYVHRGLSDQAQVDLFDTILHELTEPVVNIIFCSRSRFEIRGFRDPYVVINIIRRFHREQEAARMERLRLTNPSMYQFCVETDRRMEAIRSEIFDGL